MSPQQFSLRWNNHTKNLVQVFADQFEAQQHVDVTISCQGRFLKAHKIVLGACSPYFQELFDSHESSLHPIIIMNGYNFEDIRSIVEFMYRGEVMVAETAMQRLLAAAEELQIKGLSNVRSKRESSNASGSSQFEDHNEHDQDDQEGEGENEHELVRERSRSNSGESGSQQVVEPQAKSFIKKRKRARTQSYDNNELKRKFQASSAAQQNQPLDASTNNNPQQQQSEKDNNNAQSIDSMIKIDASSSSSSPNNDDDSKEQSIDDLPATQQPPPIVVKEEQKEKIPRPPNSFMIFANEWRRQLASQFPNESNKEISVRLGVMWKNLAEEVKAKYFTAARRANDDHKKKYPDYHYNPKEARLRKLFKLQAANMGHLVTASHH